MMMILLKSSFIRPTIAAKIHFTLFNESKFFLTKKVLCTIRTGFKCSRVENVSWIVALYSISQEGLLIFLRLEHND